MYIRNYYYQISFRFFYLCICGYGIYLNFYPDNLDNATHMFSYFTIQCNIFCFIVMFILMINSYFEFKYNEEILKKYFAHLYGMALLSIIITFLIFHFVLNNQGFTMIPLRSGYRRRLMESDIYVHYLTPLLTVTDYILFEPKGRFKWYDPFIFFTPCLFYFATTFIRCEMFNREYPYAFLNLGEIGLKKGGGFVAGFTGISILTGVLIVMVDRFSFFHMNKGKKLK